MPGRGGRSRSGEPHLTVKREVLVRYLDAWTPVALRSQHGALFVEAGDGDFVADAYRVFGESADLLATHPLEMVIVGTAADSVARASGTPPAGVSVRSVAGPEEVVAKGPALAHLDVVDGGLTEADAWRLVAALGRGRAREVLLTVPAEGSVADYCGRLDAAGLVCTVAVDLVAEDGRAQLLLFGTGDSRRVGVFKNELWAVDEFAGIRYRDPRDAGRSLVDISLRPQLVPLRRALLAELARRGSCTVGELQRYTLLETIYRPADAVDALASAVAAGAATRQPEKGRLTPRTVLGSR